jgi:hypothetical protein
MEDRDLMLHNYLIQTDLTLMELRGACSLVGQGRAGRATEMVRTHSV